MNKIPITRLKVAQINKNELPFSIRCYCLEHPAFVDTSEDIENLFCHGDIFSRCLDETTVDTIPDILPEKTVNILTDLNKQFCSFDYIMLI